MNAPDRTLHETLVVNGAQLVADLSGAAFYPAQSTLLVADLHFEKGSAFARKGLFLPPYDTRTTLARLEAAIARHRPARVVALGDSFHDCQADFRIHGEDSCTLAALVAGVEDWVWIEGNHDPAPPPRYGGRILAELTLGPLGPPKRMSSRGRSVRARCFVSDGSRLILPAFGAYTGGLNIRDAAFAPCFETRPDAWVIGRTKMYRVAGKRCLGD